MAIWRQLLILLLLAGIGYGGFLGYQHYFDAAKVEAAPSRGPRTVTVETALITREMLKQTVEAVGTSRARQSVEITPFASGRLVELAVTPGQKVQSGAILARLDDEIQRADLTEAEALLEEQTRATERAEQLRASRSVAQTTVEAAHAKLAVARATVNCAKRRLEDRVIRAPFDGQLGMADADLGALINAGDMLTRLDDLSEVEVEFSLPETLYADIRIGMPVNAIAAAFPGREFMGKVTEIDNRIDRISRSFQVRATIPNPDGELPPGMFMSLSLTLSATDYLVAPEEAIIAQAAETFVFIISEGKAERRKVKTGLRKAGMIAILSGVEPGEAVAIRGLQSLRDGADVKIVGPATEAPKS